MRKIIGVLTFISALLLGCAVDGKEGFGSLKVNVVDNQSRTITSDVSKEVSTYTITGVGPEGIDTVTMDITSGEVTIDLLYPGSWSFTVDAYNSNSDIIGTGTSDVTITTGEMTEATIVVNDISGDGTLDLSLSWNEGDIQLPVVSASLVDDEGNSYTLDFTNTEGVSSATYTGLWPAGNYRLNISLNDGEFSTISKTEEVFIFPGATSAASFTFDKINKIIGTLALTINNNMRDIIDLSVTGLPEEGIIYYETTLTVVNNSAGTTPTYEWFINGTSTGTGETLTIDPILNIGYCYISIIAEDDTNNRAGSISSLTEIRTYQLGDIGPSGGYIIYDDEADEIDDIEGYRYIEVSEFDIEGTKPWGVYNPTQMTGTVLGTGPENTLYIMERVESENTAADYCANYSVERDGYIYTDWYLPPIDELKLAYSVLKINELGNFRNSQYYSSTGNGNGANTILFSKGQEWNYNSSIGNYVRPFRMF